MMGRGYYIFNLAWNFVFFFLELGFAIGSFLRGEIGWGLFYGAFAVFFGAIFYYWIKQASRKGLL